MEQLSLFEYKETKKEEEETKRYVLISLKPEYFEWMLNGYKKYEYRSRFPDCKTFTFIYVTKPVGAIQACIEFDKPIKNHSELIGCTGQGVEDFIAGRKGNKMAIPIKSIHLLNTPIDLCTMRCYGITAPQSFSYLKADSPFLSLLKEKLGDDIDWK